MDIRLYIDEDAMAHALLQGLRARGADVLTALEADMMGRDDPAQLAFAISQERTLYSFNVGDFCRLHAEYMEQGKHHAGIIVMPRQRYGIGGQIRALLEIVQTKTADELKDRLIFLRL